MNLKMYKRPFLKSYSSEEILNIFGPIYSTYESQVSLEVWRITKLGNIGDGSIYFYINEFADAGIVRLEQNQKV